MVSKYIKIHTTIGVGFIVLALLLITIVPPNIAPEFSGTTTMRLTFDGSVTSESISEALVSFDHPVGVQTISEREYSLTTKALDDTGYVALKNALNTAGSYNIIEYESFSPSISQELVRKAFLALIAAMALIVLYISFVFKGVSRPVASWRYGVVAIIALIHDAIIPIGLFAILAPFSSAAIDALFVTALLATLGYSINDTIVIFDRVRERLRINREKKKKESFEDVVDYGTRNSVRRSVYTSVSTMIPLALLCLFVPVTQWFGLALFAGVLAGTYSSLFFAPSLLLLWNRLHPQQKQKEKEPTDTERAEETLRGVLRNDDTI